MSKHKEQTADEAYAEGLETGAAHAARDQERGQWVPYYGATNHAYQPYWLGYYKAYDGWCE